MENKNESKKESNTNENNFYNVLKKNYKIIILIFIVVIIISIMNFNNGVDCIKKIKTHGGYYQTTSSGSRSGSKLQEGLYFYSGLTKNCANGTFLNSTYRFASIFDNIFYIIVLIVAVILIPAFPAFIYVAAVYAIIYKLVTGFRSV